MKPSSDPQNRAGCRQVEHWTEECIEPAGLKLAADDARKEAKLQHPALHGVTHRWKGRKKLSKPVRVPAFLMDGHQCRDVAAIGKLRGEASRLIECLDIRAGDDDATRTDHAEEFSSFPVRIETWETEKQKLANLLFQR